MLAKTMATAFKKGNEGCFTCGDKNRLKGTALRRLIKKPPRICLHFRRGMHWAKRLNLNLILMENLFQGTSNREPPGPLQQKPRVNSIFSLKSSTSGNATVNIPALDDFFPLPLSSPF